MNEARKAIGRPKAASEPRILVVEDESDLALLLAYNLEVEGYVVERVERGALVQTVRSDRLCWRLNWLRAGYGQADKRQMQLMVRALLSMAETPEPADAADALAVALCHLQGEQARLRFALPDPRTLTRPRGVPVGAIAARGRVTRVDLTRIESTR